MDQFSLALEKNEVVAVTLVAKIFSANYETITVWRDKKSIAAYYARGAHFEVMKKWKSNLMQKPFENLDTIRYEITYGRLLELGSNVNELWRAVKNGELVTIN